MKHPPTSTRAYGTRTARNGRPQWFSADRGSLLRVGHAKHAARHHLRASATTSTVIRRALTLYADHLDRLIQLPVDDVLVQREAAALKRANLGDTTRLPEDLLLAIPVRALRDIIKAHRDSQPKAIDMIREDLRRWAANKKGNEK